MVYRKMSLSYPADHGFLRAKASLIGSLLLAVVLGWMTQDIRTSGLILLGLLFQWMSGIAVRYQREGIFLVVELGSLALLGGANWISRQAFLTKHLSWQPIGALLWLLLWTLTSRLTMKVGAGLLKGMNREDEVALPRLSTISLMFLCYLAAFMQLGSIVEGVLPWLAGCLHIPTWPPIDLHGLPWWPILVGWVGVLFQVIAWNQRQKFGRYLAFCLGGLVILWIGSWWAAFDPWWLWSVTWISTALLVGMGGYDIRRYKPRAWQISLVFGLLSLFVGLVGPVLIPILR